ncbi:D-glycero-beta-D-manno-heptose 1,7-bisphosphate 7-phosphatase [Cyanobium sp. HWJ4-Hawea]|uniref:D-glycero-beta-D-manno-heptose 1,7-bisphosphate 7-phosphatase n=1 Tax=Cyanobium sp. HWJ4-Hawea TaxID=2823713 RepID=UPI0020CC22E2|nr:D-glycero-beta-D-manno-heptose 1,7-bisphosphate 7-phosphatase [Cyanobium sp. HWJ4-Hawea]
MTNGVFDLIHRGHATYLQQASSLGATLVVAINSDTSVRLLGKGLDRPFISGDDRAYMLACLSFVDLVVLFDELTPITLIKLIRPDIYTKGGDYKPDMSEESRVVAENGGKSYFMPFLSGFSTTSLVEKIRHPRPLFRKAALLDRDGVINIDKGYVHHWSDFTFLPGAIEGLRLLQGSGYALVIITNQSGLARGYYTSDEYESLNNSLRLHLADNGIELAGIFHCPHHPNGVIEALAVECDCRKPNPGLINQAVEALWLDRDRSILIGDKISDIEAARAAGINRAYLVGAVNDQDSMASFKANAFFESLLDCAREITR